MIAALVATARAEPVSPGASTLPFELQNGRTAAGLAFEVAGAGTATAPAATPWKRTIRIVVAGEAKVSTEKLRIEEVVVETEAGASARLVPGSQPPEQDLLPGASIAIELAGTFPSPGAYRGELLLVQEAKLRVVPIKVTVAAPPAPPVPPVPPAPTPLPVQSHGGDAIALTGGDPAAWRLEVRNTGAKPLELVPAVASVARLDKPETPAYRMVVDAPGAVPPVTIAPNEVVALALRVPSLDEPGLYEVEVLLRDKAGAHTPTTLKTKIYRRHAWGWAALMIGLGALIAFLVRWFVDGGEDGIKLRGQCAALLARIRIARAEACGDAVVAAARGLEYEVEDRARAIGWNPKPKDLAPPIARAEARLLLLQEVNEASQRLDHVEPANQLELRKALDTALSVVRVDPGDDAKIAAQRTAVAALGIEAAWRKELAAWLTELEGSLAGQLDASDQLVGKLAGLRVEAAAIRASIGSGRLDAAHAGLVALQPAIVAAVAEELEGRTAPDTEPPPGIAAATWTAKTAELRAQLAIAREPTAAWAARRAAFVAAQTAYVALLVGGLIAQAELAAETAAPGDAVLLRAIAAELRTALAAGGAAAALRYATARTQIEAASAQVKGLSTARGLDPTAWLPQLFGLDAAAARPDTAAPAAPAVPWIHVARGARIGVNLVVLAIGIASGVKTLWVGDLTWGTSGALLTAFLWGAGVQAAGTTFAGMVSLRSKLGAAV